MVLSEMSESCVTDPRLIDFCSDTCRWLLPLAVLLFSGLTGADEDRGRPTKLESVEKIESEAKKLPQAIQAH